MEKSSLVPLLVTDIEFKKEGIQNNLIQWGKRNFRQFEWRENRTPYSVLVSELLLRRTTATAAKEVFKDFILFYPNLRVLSRADAKELERFLSRIGYHKQRSKILIGLANCILTSKCGEIPSSKEELLEIPNIGDYTASAILSLGYGMPSAMVDSNVERILGRVFLKYLFRKRHRVIQRVADLLAPKQDNQLYNYALLDLGALVCKYGIPWCKLCPIRRLCDYYSLDKPHRNSGCRSDE